MLENELKFEEYFLNKVRFLLFSFSNADSSFFLRSSKFIIFLSIVCAIDDALITVEFKDLISNSGSVCFSSDKVSACGRTTFRNILLSKFILNSKVKTGYFKD